MTVLWSKHVAKFYDAQIINVWFTDMNMYTIIGTAYRLIQLHISVSVNHTVTKFLQFLVLEMIAKSSDCLVLYQCVLAWTSDAWNMQQFWMCAFSWSKFLTIVSRCTEWKFSDIEVFAYCVCYIRPASELTVTRGEWTAVVCATVSSSSSALQLFVSFGLLNYSSPWFPFLCLLFPIIYSHLPQIVPHVIISS